MMSVMLPAICIDYSGNEVEVTVLEIDDDLYYVEFKDGSCNWVYKWCVSFITSY